MIPFTPAGVTWWQKPLVKVRGRVLPAELAILAMECGRNERGAWMNSRSTATGVIGLNASIGGAGRSFATQRTPLPTFVGATLASIYRRSRLAKGCPDLVIWRTDRESLRLVEVKCPHWDRPTAEQERFMKTAARCGVPTKIVEWEFR